MIIQDCVFDGNTASEAGGGIRSYWSYPTITDCTFTHQYTGGAIAIHQGATSIGNTYFCENSPVHIEGSYTDLGGNVFEDNCCPEDLNNDGSVAIADLLLVIGAWGPCQSCPEDLNGDGSVASADLIMLIAAWGDCQ